MSSQLLSLDVIFEEVAGNFSKTLSKNIKITRIEPETVKQWNTGWRPINRRKKARWRLGLGPVERTIFQKVSFACTT